MLREIRGDFIFSGQVSDEGGRPIHEATVQIKIASRRRPYPGWTDNEGRFLIQAESTTEAVIQVDAIGFESYEGEVDPSKDKDIRVTLRRYPTFTVRVYDPKGEIVRDALVMGRSAVTNKRVLLPATRDPRETYETGLFYTTEYPFEIYGSAFHRGLGVTDTLRVESHQPNLNLRMSARGVLQGRVVDKSHEPIRELVLMLKKEESEIGLARFHPEDGAFAIRSLPPGDYTLRISTPGFLIFFKEITIRERVPTVVEVVLTKRPRERR